jgi:carbamate kinase
LVIVSGGGGIPVTRRPGGSLVGVEGVIDKDLASAVLAHELGAPELYILTGVEQVTLNYGQPEEKPLPTMTLKQARQYAKEGHFPAGSMGPKVEAACHFLELGGEKVLITDTLTLQEAMAGNTGTWISP